MSDAEIVQTQVGSGAPMAVPSFMAQIKVARAELRHRHGFASAPTNSAGTGRGTWKPDDAVEFGVVTLDGAGSSCVNLPAGEPIVLDQGRQFASCHLHQRCGKLVSVEQKRP